MEGRNDLEITAEILWITEKGVRKTHIVYRANLNHEFLERYIKKLEDQDLIGYKNGNKVKTTKKGMIFSQEYKLLQFIKSLKNNEMGEPSSDQLYTKHEERFRKTCLSIAKAHPELCAEEVEIKAILDLIA